MVVVAAYMLIIPNEVNYQSIIKVINHHVIADSRMEEAFTAHSLPPNFDGQMSIFDTTPQMMCISGGVKSAHNDGMNPPQRHPLHLIYQ